MSQCRRFLSWHVCNTTHTNCNRRPGKGTKAPRNNILKMRSAHGVLHVRSGQGIRSLCMHVHACATAPVHSYILHMSLLLLHGHWSSQESVSALKCREEPSFLPPAVHTQWVVSGAGDHSECILQEVACIHIFSVLNIIQWNGCAVAHPFTTSVTSPQPWASTHCHAVLTTIQIPNWFTPYTIPTIHRYTSVESWSW